MDALQTCKELALKKRSILQKSLLQYMIRAALAGVYIGFALVLCVRVGQYFYETHSPATYLVSGIFFGIALVLIMYGGAELFTGNTMYFTVSTLQKKRRLETPFVTGSHVIAGICSVLFSLLFNCTVRDFS